MVFYNLFLFLMTIFYVGICACLLISHISKEMQIKHEEVLKAIKEQTELNVYNDKAEVEFFRSLKKAGRNRNTKENVRGN